MKGSLGFKINGSFLESPFLVRHVEGHLIFGPISRRVSLAYPLFGVVIAGVVISFFHGDESVGQWQGIGRLVDKVIFLLVPVLLLGMTRRQQAIVGWIAVKFAFGVGAIMMATVGSVMSFSRGQSDAWPNLLLGLIWIPWLEFIPSVTPYQRSITVGRVMLSIPCIYFGVRSGHWSW